MRAAPSEDASFVALVDVLADFARTLLRDYQVQDILDQLTARVRDVLPVNGAGVMLEDEAGTLRFQAASDDTVRTIESLQIELDEGPCISAYRTGKQVLLDDLSTCTTFPAFAPRAVAGGLAAVYSFPMWHERQALGALDLYSDVPGLLTRRQVAAGQTLADVATVYVLHAQNRVRSRLAEAELLRQAITDPLTGLANRRLLIDHLDLALAGSRRTGRSVAVLFLDLDNFKAVNDNLGHAAGDRLLIEVAHRVRRAVRPSDTAARIGGDEFAVVCADVAGVDEAAAIALRIFTALETPVELEGQPMVVTPSIGVAAASGGEIDADTLLAHADAAMYLAKSNGGSRIETPQH
jgi:diguanylate cyclase (GGDEF)-like protein